MHLSRSLRFIAALSLAFASGALAQADDPAGASEAVSVTDAGFAGPESVFHYAAEDVYFVSNTGSNTPGTADGFISRVSPDGTVEELKWIDAAAEGIEMFAPKGLAVVGDRLYAADYGAVRVFDVATGEQVDSVAIEESLFLNDVTPHPDGGLLVTDTGVDPATFEPDPDRVAIYRVNEDLSSSVYLQDPGLLAPNGITGLGGDRFAVVTFGDPGAVVYVENGAITETQELTGHGNFDGVVALEGGDLLVSAWTGSEVLRVTPAGEATPVLEGYAAPADIGFDADRQLVLIPQLTENMLQFVPLPTQ